MSDVIEAASAGVKDMADGSLRITFEFEPRHAAAAFALFGPRGRAVAVAALKDGAAAIPDAVIPASGKLKGGEWAKLAGMWCEDADFYEWIRPLYDDELGGEGKGKVHGDLVIGVDVQTASVFCAHALKFFAGIDSRVELDHDAAALRRFNESVRFPFMKWMEERGIVK